jgi:tRNA-dihydrouridine synthase C
MSILLAPMEGLLDFVLRDILTRVGGVDRCVSEFIRVTNTMLPDKVFYRIVPELHNQGRTFAGTPVRPQLLGSDPICLADNAARLAQLGPYGVDLNFGCPAKVVNRHGGGAALLQDPDIIHNIVLAVRKAVPAQFVVSAKMRLGFNDDSRAEENALAIATAGASELVIHGRTKLQGYRPPAYWDRINDVRQAVNIPVIANGEIWTPQDALACIEQSGCNSIMVGRGMVTNPGLGLQIRAAVLDGSARSQASIADTDGANGGIEWYQLFPLILDFWQLVVARLEPKQQGGRLKQWLNLLRRYYPEAETTYAAVRTMAHAEQITQELMRQLPELAPTI